VAPPRQVPGVATFWPDSSDVERKNIMRSFGTRLVGAAVLSAATLTVTTSSAMAAASPAPTTDTAGHTVTAQNICTYQVRGVTDWLNVRSGPGTNHGVVGRLDPNQYAEGNCRQANGPGASVWVNIKAKNGAWGWASKDYLALMP
jgi:uncharacterized protein YgiM (DUF1202 family)